MVRRIVHHYEALGGEIIQDLKDPFVEHVVIDLRVVVNVYKYIV